MSPSLLAVACALLANLGALAAGMLVMRSADQHEMRRRPADFGTRHHEPEVLRLDVLAALLQAVRHRHSEADLVAAHALIDAGLHFLAYMLHWFSSKSMAYLARGDYS